MVFKKLNKKGDVRTIAPTELVGYIIGGIIVFLILLVAGIFTTLYFSEKNEEFAVNNFIALANKIETLSKSTQQFDVQRAFPFYLPPDFVIVGFNKVWSNNIASDGCETEPVRKPYNIDGEEGKKCENSACICLFSNNDDLMDGDGYNVELIQCHKLEKVDYIIAPYLGTSTEDKDIGENYGYPKEIYKNFAGEKIQVGDYSFIGTSGYAFFYLYGQCDDYYLWYDENLQTIKLYIEKFTDNNQKTYIFIAAEYIKPDDKDKKAVIVDDRYEAMNEKYGRLVKEENQEIQ